MFYSEKVLLVTAKLKKADVNQPHFIYWVGGRYIYKRNHALGVTASPNLIFHIIPQTFIWKILNREIDKIVKQKLIRKAE